MSPQKIRQLPLEAVLIELDKRQDLKPKARMSKTKQRLMNRRDELLLGNGMVVPVTKAYYPLLKGV